VATGGTLAAATGYCADHWSYNAGANFNKYAVTRAAGFGAGSQYCLRYRRIATDTTTQALIHDIETANSIPLAGGSATLSFVVRVGSDWSGDTTITANIQTGTGTDQAQRSGAYTGSVISSFTVPVTTAASVQTVSVAVPANATQIGIYFAWAHSSTPGTNDYIEFDNVQLQPGTAGTDYVEPPRDILVTRAQRYLFKTFPYATAPTQATGSVLGAYLMNATTAGTGAERGTMFPLPATMRTTPQITTYNPVNADAQFYDYQATASCSGIVATPSDAAVIFNCTGTGTTAVGNRLGVHFVADARI
jgi:hypothetical protein